MTKSIEKIIESSDKTSATIQRLLFDMEYIIKFFPYDEKKRKMILDSYSRKIKRYTRLLKFLNEIIYNYEYTIWLENVNSEIETLTKV